MRSFGFKVVPHGDGDGKVPVSVAGQTMVDIQAVLNEIVSTILRTEFRMQGELPPDILKRYQLTIGGSDDDGVGSDPGRDGRELLEASLDMLCYTLDFMGKGVIGNWMTDNFHETLGRRRVGEALINLGDHLKGYELVYGEPGHERTFTKLNREKLLAQVEADSARTQSVARIGRICNDPAKKNRFVLTNGAFTIQADFANIIAPQGRTASVDAGLVVCLGKGEMDHDGMISAIKDIDKVSQLSVVKFNRIISKERDINLAVPLPVTVSVDKAGRHWTAGNADLGIEVTKNSWDECVLAFHEYFVFLWETYAESEEEFEGEELEVKELLISYTPLY